MRHIESHTQQDCVRWFNFQYPKFRGLLFAIPNGGKRNAREAAIMKAEGVVPGVSDLIFLRANDTYNTLCIEMKAEKGRQSELQKQWQGIAEAANNKYVICHSVDEFRTTIEQYLNNRL